MAKKKIARKVDEIALAGYIPSNVNVPVVQTEITKQNLFDNLIRYGTLRSGFISFQGIATNDLYTCPAGKEMYLTVITMALQNDAIISLPTVDVQLNNNPILTIGSGKADNAHESVCYNFALPLKLIPGDVLSIRDNRANCWVRVTFVGYEI